MYTITREIDFCYGHRLVNHPGKCRHLHGHNGKVEIVLFAEQLNTQGMVRDFEEIKTVVASWIEDHLDHKMILCKSDPIIPALQSLGESYLAIDEAPTAEVLAKMIYDYCLTQNLPIHEVGLWENEKSRASYRES